jgi:hypothetical protein
MKKRGQLQQNKPILREKLLLNTPAKAGKQALVSF